MAALTTSCAQAKPKDNDQPKSMTEWAFRAGTNLGRAEALVEGCSTGAVDPKLKQALITADGSHTPYFQVLLKGISAEAREAYSSVHEWAGQDNYDEKRCMMAVYLYGPEGTIMKNLIIPLK
jgi:hypothetical protein